MRIMRISSVVGLVPRARCSSFLMRKSRAPKTSFNCLTSSSTKPMIATVCGGGQEERFGGSGDGNWNWKRMKQVARRRRARYEEWVAAGGTDDEVEKRWKSRSKRGFEAGTGTLEIFWSLHWSWDSVQHFPCFGRPAPVLLRNRLGLAHRSRRMGGFWWGLRSLQPITSSESSWDADKNTAPGTEGLLWSHASEVLQLLGEYLQ
jgi:hypothetical protein